MTIATPLHRLVLAVWLVVVWVTLWGSVTLANVGGGLLLALAILLAFPPAPVRPDRSARPDEIPSDSDDAGATVGSPEADTVLPEPERLRVNPLALGSLGGWFVGALVVSTWQVAVAAVTPPGRSKIRTEIVDVRLRASSPVVTTLVSNAITLTPGTLTLEALGTPATLSVHGMFVEDADSVRADVWDIERRVVAAVGSRTDRAAVAESGSGPAAGGPVGHDRSGGER